MEVKVFVDGIPRVVCGVTEETMCHEVVIALAQSLSQPGRYTLREKFKDFERCMAPNERLLETLERYGEQAKEVQLTLIHNGPRALWDETCRTKVGRYQPGPPLRRKDAGARIRRGSGPHRQSLPPLSCLRQEAEQQKEDTKRPKRKSLTLMEEAWEWLESLGKGKVYSTTCDKDSSKRSDQLNRISLDFSLAVDGEKFDRGGKSRVRGQKSLKSDLDQQTSCCMGGQTRGKDGKHSKKTPKAKCDDTAKLEDEENGLRKTIICQISCLQDLKVQMDRIDKQISELEERQKAQKAEQDAQRRRAEDELEQISFWENELKAEEGYEKDLQGQFLEMRAKAVACKAKLEEYKCQMQGLDFFTAQGVREDSEVDFRLSSKAAAEISAPSTEAASWQQSDPHRDVNTNRKFLPSGDLKPPHALVPPSQLRERRPTGPTELREWWTRWSEAKNSQPQTKRKVIHRSELTIYLGSTKV